MAAVRYAGRDGWRLIVRHWGMSLLTIFTAMSVFFIIGTSTLFVLNVRNIVSSLENQLTIQAYLKPKTDVKAAEKAISALPEVKSVKIITKDMALERLRSRIGEQAKAVMLLGENPLPESVEVKVKRASQVAETARLLVAVPEVEDIVYAGRVAEKLTRVSGFVEKFSVIMLIVAVAASGIVLFNTIRISVYSRAEEINVMMMVGATSTYVTLPFVIQGFILGLTGALLASLLLGGTYYTAVSRLREMLPFIPFIESTRLTGKLAFMLVCCGATVSLVASLMAVEKFIRKASRPL